MAINEDGEYELHILDTQDQYNAYLRKYGLQGAGQQVIGQVIPGQQQVIPDQQQVIPDQQEEQQPGFGVEAEGGKRRTKTKKHKRVKHNTKRVPKVRLNKSKRKVVRKATKTRSRK